MASFNLPSLPALPELPFGSRPIGLDLGTSSVKLVQLSPKGKGGWLMTACAIQDLGDDAVDEVEGDLRSAVVGAAIKKALKASKASGRKVTSGVGGDAVIVRYIKLPFMSPKELGNVIAYEAEQHIPLPLDQVVLDHHVLGQIEEDGQKKLEVLLVAAKADLVDEHIALLRASRLKPVVVDVDSFALENAYLANYGVEKGQTVALANIGAKITTINIVEDGVSHLTRDFAVAGNQFTKQIQLDLSLGFAQAEELKRQQGQVVVEGDEMMLTRMPDKDDRSMAISEAVIPILNKMLGEFRRSFDFYENSIKKRPVTKLLLSGGGTRLKNIEKFFADKLGVPAEIADPFKRVEIAKGLDAAGIRAAGPSLMVAIGLALRRGLAIMIQLNLLPPKVRAAERLRKTVIASVVAYAVGGGWLCWQWSLNHVRLVEARHEVQRVQAQLNSPELQVAVRAVKKFADDMAAVKAKASVVNALRKQQVPVLQALDAAPDWCMGGRVWFTHLDVDPGASGGANVGLTGLIQSRAGFAQYYEFLAGLPGVQGISLAGAPTDTTLSGDKLVLFNLKFSVEARP